MMKKNTFVNRLGMLAINHPWWVLLFSLIFVGLSGTGLTKLEFVNNYRVFFGEENPQLLAFDELQNTYSKSDNVMILVEPANGDVFTRENLQAIVELTYLRSFYWRKSLIYGFRLILTQKFPLKSMVFF